MRSARSNLPSKRLFFRFLFADLLHHEAFHPTEFLLKSVGEIVCAIFEKNNEAECEEDEESDPKYPAQQRHGASLTEALF